MCDGPSADVDLSARRSTDASNWSTSSQPDASNRSRTTSFDGGDRVPEPPGSSVSGPRGQRVSGSAGQGVLEWPSPRVGGPPGRRVAGQRAGGRRAGQRASGPAGRRVGGSAGRRVGGSAGRRVGGSAGGKHHRWQVRRPGQVVVSCPGSDRRLPRPGSGAGARVGLSRSSVAPLVSAGSVDHQAATGGRCWCRSGGLDRRSGRGCFPSGW